MSINASARATADRLIAAHGGPATLTHTETTASGPYDEGTTTTTNTQVQVARTGFDAGLDNPLLLRSGDWLGVMKVGEAVPLPLDTLTVGGIAYTIMEVKRLGADPEQVAAYAITAKV
ncbi:MAG: hypothetical protein IE938_20665 [Pseudomonas balearica]|nr:hypothetical protein [Stutzerimonas balearica]